MNKFILASASPRRKELLTQIGMTFDIIESTTDETITEKVSPKEFVEILSKRKALNVMEKINSKNLFSEYDSIVVIGSDTVVTDENEILGKPSDKQNAFNMLKKLQGSSHLVYTGLTIAVAKNGNTTSKTVSNCAKVVMRSLSDNEIKNYINSGECNDKAGAYAIQGKGALLIEKIEGDYYTIVGLPLVTLCNTLKTFNIEIL